MKKSELEKRVAELEKEVRELKARPAIQHHHHYQAVPYYQPVPYYIPAPQPWPYLQPYYTAPVFGAGTIGAGIGQNVTMGNCQLIA